MATVTSVPFVIQSVVFHSRDTTATTIFDDVEAAKLRVVEARRNSKRSLDGGAGGRPSQHTASSSSAGGDDRSLQRSLAIRSLLEAESKRVEVIATRAALEKRRDAIYAEMKQVTSMIEQLRAVDETMTEETESVSVPQRKKQRYFDAVVDTSLARPQRATSSRESEPIQDDLSTVVCPFELMGQCTDPECLHMHLNR